MLFSPTPSPWEGRGGVTSTRPPIGTCNPAIVRRNVDFPVPFRPTRQVSSPPVSSPVSRSAITFTLRPVRYPIVKSWNRTCIIIGFLMQKYTFSHIPPNFSTKNHPPINMRTKIRKRHLFCLISHKGSDPLCYSAMVKSSWRFSRLARATLMRMGSPNWYL